MQPQGAQRCWHPPPLEPPPHLGLQSFWGPCCNAPPRLCPLWGEIKVQTVVPLWAERHQRGGVAPGCKALAEEAWRGAHQFPQTLPPHPSTAGCLGIPSSAPQAPWGSPSF